MELWRQCAAWLIDCRVLPDNHRVTWESAQVSRPFPCVTHLQTSEPPPPAPPSDLCVCVWGSGLWPGAGPQRWRAALPVAQQPAAPGRQPEGDQPASADVPGNTCARRTSFLSVSMVTGRHWSCPCRKIIGFLSEANVKKEKEKRKESTIPKKKKIILLKPGFHRYIHVRSISFKASMSITDK